MQQPAQSNQPTPQQVFNEAVRLLRVGDVYEASRRAGKLRAHFPDDVPIIALHGLVLAKLGLHPQALSDLVRAAQLTEEALKEEDDEGNPSRPRIVDQLVRLSVQICRSSTAIGEFEAAEEAIDNALGWDPDRADAVGAKAEMLGADGDYKDAYELIAQGFKDKLDTMPLVLARAHVLLMDPESSDESLAEVIPELENEISVAGLPVLDLGDLLRTLGLIHDRLGHFDDAFNAYRRAAHLRRSSYDPRSYTLMTTKVITDWSLSNMSKVVKPDASGKNHTLILGAPMSGATQLAELLGEFDGIRVVGPLETLSAACIQYLGAKQGVLRPVPFQPNMLRGNQLRDAGRAYSAQVSMMAGDQSSNCIDTHPLNIPLAGAAAMMLPGINIVMCRRDPIESAMGCYCDAMPGNHPYAGEMIDAAGFVADSNRMLDHWAQVLGDDSIGAKIIEVQYSELAADPKKTAARVARELGVDARATSIKRVPSMIAGPSTHPQDYKNYTRQIRDLLEPVKA